MHETKVGEIARKNFPIIAPDETAADALTSMRTAHVTVAPVEEDGMLKGIITIENLLEASDIFNGKTTDNDKE